MLLDVDDEISDGGGGGRSIGGPRSIDCLDIGMIGGVQDERPPLETVVLLVAADMDDDFFIGR